MTDNHCRVNKIRVPEHKTRYNSTFVGSDVPNATVPKLLTFLTNFHILSQKGVWPLGRDSTYYKLKFQGTGIVSG